MTSAERNPIRREDTHRMLLDTEEVAPGVTKVNLRGRLDAAGARAIEATFAALARTQYDMIVDLSRVSFIASMGLRVLIAGFRTLAAHGGRMGILRPDTAVEAVLISSGTDMMIPVFADLGEAIRGVCGALANEEGPAVASRAFALQVERAAAGVTQVGAWVDELAGTLTLGSRTEYALRLCLEEAVGLIVTNPGPPDGAGGWRDSGTMSPAGAAGSADGAEPSVLLRLVAEPARLCVTIQDRGPAIDPLVTPHPDGGHEPLDGTGVGLGLMRQYAREVTWSRIGDTNRLTMIVPR